MNGNIEPTMSEFSIKDFFDTLKSWKSYFFSKLLLILIVSILGGMVGLFYSYKQPLTYIAKLTFIIEEGKSSSSGLGSLASIAGQFGVDVGGESGSSILSGENIILYFKSPTLAKEILLSKFDTLTKETIADRYATVYGLNEIWSENKKIGKINFADINNSLEKSRLKDSLLQSIVEQILKYQFSVSRTDKKASFIDVSTKMQDEVLAKEYCEKIVKRVVDKYISVKIQRQRNTVNRLQERVDSIAFLLSKKTSSAALLQNSATTMDINPLFKTGTNVAVETNLRDKAILSTIFATITQNLELAKFTLSQETPVIQVIDSPNFPLKKDQVSIPKTTLLFSLVFFLATIFFLIINRLLNTAMK